MGRFSDRVGRRPVLLLTLGGTCLGYGLWIFAGSFWILVLSRIIGGIASGNLSVATASIAMLHREKIAPRVWPLWGLPLVWGLCLDRLLVGTPVRGLVH